MSSGAKRKHGATEPDPPLNSSTTSSLPVKRDLLKASYPFLKTLRESMLSRLPTASRLRRKKIATLGTTDGCSESEAQLARALDTTLVCTRQVVEDESTSSTTWQQWLSFSQKADESNVTISDASEAVSSQSEIVDFVIWLLFSRERKAGSWPKNILCDGYRRTTSETDSGGSTIPGISSRFPNHNVSTLRAAPWPQVLALLGQSGEKAMLGLLLDCSIFVAVDAGYGNYYQLNGLPLSELKQLGAAEAQAKTVYRRATDITLTRSRIFYAKPALNARGLVRPGFKHIHVLNRCTLGPKTTSSLPADTAKKNEACTLKVMMYIFPRQFHLHNVFTSEVDKSQTSQKFLDYTLREEEIASSRQRGEDTLKIPRRLRGAARDLVERLQVRHARCAYGELLRHYCPSPLQTQRRIRGGNSGPTRESVYHSQSRNTTQTQSTLSHSRPRNRKQTRKSPQLSLTLQYENITDLSCPMAKVSAFCQSVLSSLVPDGFWGECDIMQHNKAMVLSKVDRFIRMRRFETMSLHEVTQGLKIADIGWLQPPHLQGQRASQTDVAKRTEIFQEFLYYVFDSLLLPLIRSNFYVTESNSHRHQVLYFRHDVWRYVAEPAMAKLKQSMLEEVKVLDATRILDARSLGFSQIRLLPKGKDMRPITNLRKRTLGVGRSKVLGPSINSVLSPMHTVLKFEKEANPAKLGATMFSVNDIYGRLRGFKESLSASHPPLYFAKVDVRGAFDTLPQDAVLRLMASVPSEGQYTISKHVEVKPGDCGTQGFKPIRRWLSTAHGQSSSPAFLDRVEGQLGQRARNTVFIDQAIRKTQTTGQLMKLLNQHIGQNLVKVGKKFYRQKKGIPQGSVLSAILCNYFYADLESRHLGFLRGSDCLLMRLIDDFLLITTDRNKAERFVRIMHGGLPEYGMEVSPLKTLVNFDMAVDQGPVGRLAEGHWFPYCGTIIDCDTLEITKDMERRQSADIAHSLTVELGRVPGQQFERKVLNALKIQLHVMYFDTNHNSVRTVLETLHSVFRETACKMWAYIRHMPKPQRPRSSLVIHAIQAVIGVAFLLLTSKSRKARYEKYACDIRRAHVAIAACDAFTEVLQKKQATYGDVLEWLQQEAVRLAEVRK